MMCEPISNEEIIELIREVHHNDQEIMKCVRNVMADSLLNETNRRTALCQILKYPREVAIHFYGGN